MVLMVLMALLVINEQVDGVAVIDVVVVTCRCE